MCCGVAGLPACCLGSVSAAVGLVRLRLAFGHVVPAVCVVALPGGRGVVLVALRMLPLAVCALALLGFLLVSRARFRPPCGLYRCSTGGWFVVVGR